MTETTTMAGWSTLGTKEQVEKERLALRVLASDAVQAELRNLEQIYAADAIEAMPMGRETLKSAAASMAMSAVMGAVNKDTDRPVILWGANAAHKWHGLDVPRSGLVQDNPDNVYRSVPIDGAAAYEIRGHVIPKAPAQQTYVLYASTPGADGGEVKENLAEAGAVDLKDIAVAADGSFVITIDSSPTGGRKNHLQTPPTSRKAQILIRDSLSDWSTESPPRLSIHRLSGPEVKPAPSEADLVAAAAQQLKSIGRYWLDWEHRVFFSRPVNTCSLNFARVSGWGHAKGGHFSLAEDEAIVTTIERRGADYFAFQLADLWGPAVEYIARNGSLNQTQAKPDADGAYTFVIAANDPGVHNWLDPNGLPAGTFTIRWQGIAPGSIDDTAIRTFDIVKLADLKAKLPAGTAWVTSDGRRAQITERAASYARRLET